MTGRRGQRIEYVGKLSFLLQRTVREYDDAVRIAIDANAFEAEIPARDQADLQVLRVISHEAVEHLLEPRAWRAIPLSPLETRAHDGNCASTSASSETSDSAVVKRCPSSCVDISRLCCASCTSIVRFARYA